MNRNANPIAASRAARSSSRGPGWSELTEMLGRASRSVMRCLTCTSAMTPGAGTGPAKSSRMSPNRVGLWIVPRLAGLTESRSLAS